MLLNRMIHSRLFNHYCNLWHISMPLCVYVHLYMFVCKSDLSKHVSVVEKGNTSTVYMGTGVLVMVC